MARVLVHTRPRLLHPLLAPTGTRPGCLRPHKTPEPSWSGAHPIPMPQARYIPSRPHPALRRRPLHTQCGRHGLPQHLLAQGPEMDYKLLLSNAHLDPLGRILPRASPPPDLPTAKTSSAWRYMLPPEVNPAMPRLYAAFPSLSSHCARDFSRALMRGLKSVYLPLHWKTLRPVPSIMNHLPIEVVAYQTLPFTHTLSRMPMINSHLVSPALAVPPQSLIDNSHSAQRKG